MGQIKVVLIFNEDDERQREAGEYLKTKKRCKTALVTELVQAWMKNGETGAGISTALTLRQQREAFLWYQGIKKNLGRGICFR